MKIKPTSEVSMYKTVIGSLKKDTKCKFINVLRIALQQSQFQTFLNLSEVLTKLQVGYWYFTNQESLIFVAFARSRLYPQSANAGDIAEQFLDSPFVHHVPLLLRRLTMVDFDVLNSRELAELCACIVYLTSSMQHLRLHTYSLLYWQLERLLS